MNETRLRLSLFANYLNQPSRMRLWKLYLIMFDTTTQTFIHHATNVDLQCLDNGSDLFIYPNIQDSIIHPLRSNFQLHLDETILYVRDTSFWNDKNQGIVISDWGLTCVPDNDKKDSLIQLPWIDVLYAEYSGQTIYFFLSDNRNDNTPIHITHFLKNTDDEDTCKCNGDILASIFTLMAQTQTKEDEDERFQKVWKEFNSLIADNKIDEAIQLGLLGREEFGDVQFTANLANILYFNKGQTEKALQILDEDIPRLPEDSYTWRCMLNYTKHSIYSFNKDFISARKPCLYEIKHAPSDLFLPNGVNLLEDATADFARYESYYVEHFLEQPYNQRKLLIPVKAYTDLSQELLSVVDINNLPAINFPIGHPIANQLYVGHPYLASKYIPFENYELELIEDKVREFCVIMQSLGATEINIECLNSSTNKKDTSIHQKGSASINYKFASASGDGQKDRNSKFFEDISQCINLRQKFEPKSKPELPSNLVWYPNEPSWQRLYKQRLQGGFLEHEERIETRKSQVVENSELKQVSAEVKWLFIQANGNWEQSMEEKFEGHENAILSIRVQFAPLESLTECSKIELITEPKVVSNSLTPEEEEYLEEVNACLEEDNEISPRERRLLNRLRDKLGISESRAMELEENNKPILFTDDELEYLEEFRACMEEDGEITPKSRRLLDKFRAKLEISDDRALQIENYKK